MSFLLCSEKNGRFQSTWLYLFSYKMQCIVYGLGHNVSNMYLVQIYIYFFYLCYFETYFTFFQVLDIKIYIYIIKVFFSPMEGIIQCGHLKLNYRCHCYLFLQKWLVPGHLTILQYIFFKLLVWKVLFTILLPYHPLYHIKHF